MIASACSGGTTSASSGARRHADAGKAALGEPEEQHGDSGCEQEKRIGEHEG